MSFLTTTWLRELNRVVHKIKGAFIMGGVYSDAKPLTMPAITNVLNRFSIATMNQLYSPLKSGLFFQFLRDNSIPTYTVANNAVSDLLTDQDKIDKTYLGVDAFLDSNRLNGSFLRAVANAYYNSGNKPPAKAFDYYSALALVTVMKNQMPRTNKMTLHFNDQYGITMISKNEGWKETFDSYTANVDAKPMESDNDFIKAEKQTLAKEILIMRKLETPFAIAVSDVHFCLFELKKLIVIDPE